MSLQSQPQSWLAACAPCVLFEEHAWDYCTCPAAAGQKQPVMEFVRTHCTAPTISMRYMRGLGSGLLHLPGTSCLVFCTCEAAHTFGFSMQAWGTRGVFACTAIFPLLVTLSAAFISGRTPPLLLLKAGCGVCAVLYSCAAAVSVSLHTGTPVQMGKE